MASPEDENGGWRPFPPADMESPFMEEIFQREGQPWQPAFETGSPFTGAFETEAEPDGFEYDVEEPPEDRSCNGIIGDDQRVKVNDPRGFPYRWICQISGVQRRDGKLRKFGPMGTGILISPRYVLTAAHLLRSSEKDPRTGLWVDKEAERLVVIPARNDDASGSQKRPFGAYEVKSWKISPKYNPRAANAWLYDYAILELADVAGAKRTPALKNKPLCFWGSEDCGGGTFLEVVPANFLQGRTAWTAGYPFDRGGGTRLLTVSGMLSGLDIRGRGEIMNFNADGCPGQSGSPIWIERNGRRYLVGIFTRVGTVIDADTGRVSGNEAVRITKEVFDQISQWFEAVRETPWLGAQETQAETRAVEWSGEREWEAEGGGETEGGEDFGAEAESEAEDAGQYEWSADEVEGLLPYSAEDYPVDARQEGLLEQYEPVDRQEWQPETEYEAEPGWRGAFAPAALEADEEEFGEFENYLEEDELEQGDKNARGEAALGELLLESALFEGEPPKGQPGGVFEAQIKIVKAAAGKKPVELALVVQRWEPAESKKLSGARLKLFECDTGESGRSDTAAAQNVQMAEFTLDLAPNPEYIKDPGKAGVPRVTASGAKWANPTLEKSYKATRKADLILRIGKAAFPLWISRQDIHEEGSALELGFVLEDGAGNTLERLSITGGQVLSLPITDHLQELLTIPGRFDDPQRDPAIDMDGTKFDVFLKGKDRRAFIARCLENIPALKEAANEPDADLKTSDIIKAWFVIHDVGAKATLTDKRFKASQPKTKKGAVHGFLNRAGYYSATHDFTKNRQGTVYEFLSKQGLKIVNGRTINIETVPDIEKDVPDKPDGSHGDPANPDLYGSIGYRKVYTKSGGKTVYAKKVTYYKWTKAALDVLAELYVFASARARHLLTITVHKEMDRNLGQSVIWREYSAAEIRAASSSSFLGKARDKPHNYHGDPNGFNIQALYDLITQKLNALGGKQMPAGARYGIHPRRVSQADGEDITNGSHHLHTFPHQSDPDVKNDTGLKRSGWWKTS